MSIFKKIIKDVSPDLNIPGDTYSPPVTDTSIIGANDDSPYAPQAEANINKEYRKIKSQLIASKNTDRPIQSFMVAGSVSEEGATTLAITLAHAMATGNAYRTLLVDGNLRRPSIHKYLRLRNEVGLSELLSSAPWSIPGGHLE